MPFVKKNALTDLPNESIQNILTYLTSEDLLNLSIVGNERFPRCR